MADSSSLSGRDLDAAVNEAIWLPFVPFLPAYSSVGGPLSPLLSWLQERGYDVRIVALRHKNMPVWCVVAGRGNGREGENMSDSVHHPLHYGGAENVYEAIKVIEAWDLDFCLGNTVKYIARAGKKNAATELEDLRKAMWYLNRRIEQLEKEQGNGRDGQSENQ